MENQMVNNDHFNILMRGMDAWNEWREQNIEICPDLIKATLSDLDLSGINLSMTDLHGAYLIEVDLHGANLGGADLSGANLDQVNLRGVNLGGADFSGVNLGEIDLYGVNFVGADLSGVNFGGSDLSGAKFSEANLDGANLWGVNFSGVDLSRINLSGTDLTGANLKKANLSEAYLYSANLWMANLAGADLTGADLSEANLGGANITGANLSKANLRKANLSGANLCRVDLNGTDLIQANLVETNFYGANLTGCRIYGISVWNPQLEGATQTDLIITRQAEPTITVDNLEVAQFIYLLLHNEKIREVIDTISHKVVLILGRFGEHKAILDGIRNELRKLNYLPIMFDFEKPTSRDYTETIRILAYLSRFIIADITEPRSIPHELQAIIPDLAVPVQPLLFEGSTGEYAMFQDLKRKYDWVLPVHQYKDRTHLLSSLGEKVINPAEAKAKELENK